MYMESIKIIFFFHAGKEGGHKRPVFLRLEIVQMVGEDFY